MNIDFSTLARQAWDQLVAWVIGHGLTVVLILIAALIVMRLSRVVGGRIVAAASDQDETTNTVCVQVKGQNDNWGMHMQGEVRVQLP